MSDQYRTVPVSMGDPYRTAPECDHGVVFDEVDCKAEWEARPSRTGKTDYDYALQSAHFTQAVRKRWPRLFGECPKGCGYHGIAYASRAHFVWGDW